LDHGLTRRSFLGAAAAALCLSPAASAAQADHGRLRLTLFPPTGPLSVGTVSLYLVDHSRRDPWFPTRPRELMVSVWYPALNVASYGWAPWIPSAAGALYLNQFAGSLQTTSTGPAAGASQVSSLPGVSLPITQAREGAPVHLSTQPYPVVLYQPGLGDIRETATGLVSDLASHGYIVVTMDDTYEAQVVEFPDGRLATTRPNQSHVGPARLADTRFVLDELVRLRSGTNPDALHRTVPTGLTEAIDTSKVGMFGHSIGGAMAAQAMAADSRIHAGTDLDGTILVKKRSLNPTLDENLARQLGDRPFMLFTRQGHDAQNDPTLAGFWAGLSGPRLFIALKDAEHFSFTDFEEFLPELLSAGIRPDKITRALVASYVGTIDPKQAVAAERAYIAAFFDLHLRGQSSRLLNGPSPDYPQIQFLGR
jgi:predicted dienelactone hydrolase